MDLIITKCVSCHGEKRMLQPTQVKNREHGEKNQSFSDGLWKMNKHSPVSKIKEKEL